MEVRERGFMKNGKIYKKIKKCTSVLLSSVLIAGMFSVNVKTLAAQNKEISGNVQIDWTGNTLQIDEGRNGVDETVEVSSDLNVSISGTVSINVKSNATGTLGSLTIGSGCNINFETGTTSNAEINIINNNSMMGAGSAPGVVVRANGTLKCMDLNNSGCVNNLGTLTCSRALENNSSAEFYSNASTTTSCGYFNNSGMFSGTGTFNCTGTITNTAGVYVDAGELICENITGTGLVDVRAGGSLTVNDTLDCTGKVQILNSTVNVGTFVTPTEGYNAGSGELSAAKIIWNKGFTNSATVKVTDSLTFDGYDLDTGTSIGAPFTANANTIINSDGATFSLKVGDTSKQILGEIITDKKASWAMKDEPTVSVGFTIYTDFVYGKNYNYSSYITTTSDGTPKVTFKNASDSWGDVEVGDAYTTPPTKIGTYVMHVDIPETSTYRDVSTRQAFRISGIPMGLVYCTIEQTPVYSDFYNEPVTLIAPDGYTISPDDGETVPFDTKYTITEDGFYYGVSGVYKDEEGGKSDPNGAHGLYDGSFYIDQTGPVILQDTAFDQDDKAISVDIEDGVTIKARYVRFVVQDVIGTYARTLKTVTVDGNDIYVDGDMGTAEVELTSLVPGKKTHTIVATDVANNTSTWKVTLEYLPAVTPDEPFTVSGTEGKNGYYKSEVTLIPATGYKISADVNGTFTDSLKYSPDIESVYLMDAIGLYTNPIPVSFNIDMSKPQFSTAIDENEKKFDIKDGLEVHAKKLGFSISDDNLTTVTVNGGAVDIVGGVAAIELVPEAGKTENFEIFAEDIAGNSVQATITVEYRKDVATATVSVGAEYVGQIIEPVLTTNSNGDAQFFYKRVGASDDTYVSEKPNAEGEYIVQVRIPATDNFTAVTEEGTFKLSYLTAPETAFTVSGKKKKNDFYTTDVELVAPEGFKISNAADGKYKASVTYTEGMDKIYLMRDDGALTGAIVFNKKYKIDKLTPEASKTGTITNNKTLKTKSIDIKNGLSIFADTLDFSIFDENLIAITINGESVEFNEKTAKILLDANNTTSKFNIVAEDKAGNKTSLSIVLKAAWLENNIIPAGAKITLEAGQVYNLEGGKWTVSGDSTVYYGGNKFCVDGSMDCIFTEKK